MSFGATADQREAGDHGEVVENKTTTVNMAVMTMIFLMTMAKKNSMSS